MVQPARDFTPGLSTEACSLLRCSPIVCIHDGIQVLVIFAYLTCSGKSPRDAARSIACSRFSKSTREAGMTPSSFPKLQENALLQIFIFIALALTQTTKLWAVRGIFWTKVWASMFVSSFVVLEVIKLQPGRGWRRSNASTSPCCHSTGVRVV